MGRKRKPNYTSLGTIIALILVLLLILFSGKLFGSGTDSPTIAKVNGEKILLSDLEEGYAILPPQMKASLTKDMYLEQLIDEYLLLDAADEKGYQATETDAYLVIRQSIIYSGLTEEQFFAQAEATGVTKEYLLEFYRKQIKINALLNETVLSKIDVSDEALQAYFESRKDEYLLPERHNVSFFFLAAPNESALILAERSARSFTKKLSPDTFAALAKVYSEDQFAQNGGHPGTLITREFATGIQILDELVFAQDAPGVYGPVQSELGFHFIHLHEVLPQAPANFEDVRQKLESQLYVEEQQQLLREYMEALRANADIKRIYRDDVALKAAAEFKETGDEMCLENDVPLVIMYGTSKCTHCGWSAHPYSNAIKKYASAGFIRAHLIMLDTKDDLLTPDKETEIKPEYIDLFTRYTTDQQVPLFVFGCTHVRLGNAYEESGDLAAEEAEFVKILDLLIQ